MADSKDVAADKKKVKALETLRGMRDILPDEQIYWEYFRRKAREIAETYSYGRIETPILEQEKLFSRTLGKQTDVVEKEMYSFDDKGGDKVALRPEATASVVRAYINHGMLNLPQPVKMWYMGPMFRYDRPQSGRYRQFYQYGLEVIGGGDSVVDAQLILIATKLFEDLGLKVKVEINSIGTAQTRQEYKIELVAYARKNKKDLCEDCMRRMAKNPLRLLDCKVPACHEVMKNAPQIVDWLDDPSRDHFMELIEYLDEVGVPYVLNPHLVRGLDYYNRTVFEIVPDRGDDSEPGSQSALAAGGRYDELVEMMGGREETPAVGFAVGIERAILEMKQQNVEPPALSAPDVFFAQLGKEARRTSLRLFEEVRAAGFNVVEAFGKASLKAQLESANKVGAHVAVILGQQEVQDDTIIVRDMDSGSQETIPIEKLIDNLKRILK
ncbi:histidine--tRNA ligase [Candidatus Uhrbacteria bacterium CG10_big_fil_rev_8_21_14_0_10_50_16]|uniref:Histidine--tRNA ligase n=1 Tax=Candidatus Uhrbacteria bacterium CG10_big_fil_rev_8_21_14_0_10_50_16 TaxID=1975039 RepID=A0A2H0RPA2_9BACT|nr:MAG: histidine--tRNA ligase [Candidatus Uhrbacteria bacterium CG10_big_fil_rev_8_21_14_0_10_50_16]